MSSLLCTQRQLAQLAAGPAPSLDSLRGAVLTLGAWHTAAERQRGSEARLLSTSASNTATALQQCARALNCSGKGATEAAQLALNTLHCSVHLITAALRAHAAQRSAVPAAAALHDAVHALDAPLATLYHDAGAPTLMRALAAALRGHLHTLHSPESAKHLGRADALLKAYKAPATTKRWVVAWIPSHREDCIGVVSEGFIAAQLRAQITEAFADMQEEAGNARATVAVVSDVTNAGDVCKRELFESCAAGRGTACDRCGAAATGSCPLRGCKRCQAVFFCSRCAAACMTDSRVRTVPRQMQCVVARQ